MSSQFGKVFCISESDHDLHRPFRVVFILAVERNFAGTAESCMNDIHVSSVSTSLLPVAAKLTFHGATEVAVDCLDDGFDGINPVELRNDSQRPDYARKPINIPSTDACCHLQLFWHCAAL